jgi:hypothetical protein
VTNHFRLFLVKETRKRVLIWRLVAFEFRARLQAPAQLLFVAFCLLVNNGTCTMHIPAWTGVHPIFPNRHMVPVLS